MSSRRQVQVRFLVSQSLEFQYYFSPFFFQSWAPSGKYVLIDIAALCSFIYREFRAKGTGCEFESSHASWLLPGHVCPGSDYEPRKSFCFRCIWV